MPEPKRTDAAPHADPEQAKLAEMTRQAPYRWLSEVEDLCRRAFVSDQIIRERVTARVMARAARKIAPRESPLAWSKALDREPTDSELALIESRTAAKIANRDLLAHRIERESPTKRWQSCLSDSYHSARAYRWRLGAIGAIMSEMGWIREPTHNPWSLKPRKSDDMTERAADAEATAEGWVG